MGMILNEGITGMYDYTPVEVKPNKIIPIQTTTPENIPVSNPIKDKDKYENPQNQSYLDQTLVGMGINTVEDFWGLLLGTGQEKLNALADTYGKINPEIGAKIDELNSQYLTTLENWDKQQYLTTGLTTPTPIEINMPEFPDIFAGLKDVGKWLLIGGGVIAGAWLLGKFIGRGKK